MARRKKYEEIVDLSNYGLLDFLERLKNDSIVQKELCSGSYTITTNGGRGKVWQVNEKDFTRFTVSTECLERIKVNPYVSVPKYRHYILTEKGIAEIKQLVVEHSI